MPSDKRNSIIAKPTGLIFSLFDVASSREVPFGMSQHVQCILHGLTSVLLCVHSSLLRVDLAVARDGFSSKQKSSVFFLVDIFDCSSALRTVLDLKCCAMGQSLWSGIGRLDFSEKIEIAVIKIYSNRTVTVIL